jgi:hypothetical protein
VKWDTRNPQAPYHPATGSLLDYPVGPHEFRPVRPFSARLVLIGFSRGRSSAVARWSDMRTGARYPMFLTDLEELLSHRVVSAGETEMETWTVRKRGQNYGIALSPVVILA